MKIIDMRESIASKDRIFTHTYILAIEVPVSTEEGNELLLRLDTGYTIMFTGNETARIKEVLNG